MKAEAGAKVPASSWWWVRGWGWCVRRRAWFATAAAVLVVGLAVWAWSEMPALYPLTVDPQADAGARAAREASRAQSIVTTRASVLAGLAGAGALVTIWINYRNSRTNTLTLRTTQETFRITERGHLTERYTRAVDQIGDAGSVAVRLGGIYALEQLAVDSPRSGDHATVVEVLSAFVRLHLPPAPPLEDSSIAWLDGRPVLGPGSLRPLPPPRPRSEPPVPVPIDVAAALTVLGRLPSRDDIPRADLSGLDLAGADLLGVDLAGANLMRADLSRATLIHMNFRDALLCGAVLFEANLIGAHLDGAHLDGAHLERAHLVQAQLLGADFTGAGLEDADLYGATDASLTEEQLAVVRRRPDGSSPPVGTGGVVIEDLDVEGDDE